MGSVYCLLSAAGFGAMAVFGKLAFDAGVSVDALLMTRFGLAGGLLLAAAFARGSLRRLPARAVLIGLAMGAIGYAAQAGLYFSALTRIDASLVALILYVYPVLVTVGAIVLGRERADRRRVWALGLALAGIGMVLGGAGTGRFDWVGGLLALGAAFTYTGYILVGDRLTSDVPALALAALVCTGAFGTFVITGALRDVDLDFAPSGWWWLGALALVSTVGAILLFFAGLARVGPSKAAVLSIFEPVVTVAAASAVFGETLGPAQWLGGILVLAAVSIGVGRSARRDGREARQGGQQLPSAEARPPVAGPADERKLPVGLQHRDRDHATVTARAATHAGRGHLQPAPRRSGPTRTPPRRYAAFGWRSRPGPASRPGRWRSARRSRS
ncbi:MAG TPA: DMT family transporter [Nakamurella sp.]